MPDEFSNGRNRHFIISLHTFPLLHKLSGAKNCAGQRDIKSEQYSFVCVLRVDRLPGLDNPMQSPRRRARFPAASVLHKGTCGAICQNQNHDRRAIVGVCNCNNGGELTSAAGRGVSPCFQYSVQSLSRYRFRLIGRTLRRVLIRDKKSFSILI